MSLNTETRVEVTYALTDRSRPQHNFTRACLNVGMYAAMIGIIAGASTSMVGNHRGDEEMRLSGLVVFLGSTAGGAVMAIAEECLGWRAPEAPLR